LIGERRLGYIASFKFFLEYSDQARGSGDEKDEVEIALLNIFRYYSRVSPVELWKVLCCLLLRGRTDSREGNMKGKKNQIRYMKGKIFASLHPRIIRHPV
jgi:ABC-type ATPase with predicted acetyltransferase domain